MIEICTMKGDKSDDSMFIRKVKLTLRVVKSVNNNVLTGRMDHTAVIQSNSRVLYRKSYILSTEIIVQNRKLVRFLYIIRQNLVLIIKEGVAQLLTIPFFAT